MSAITLAREGYRVDVYEEHQMVGFPRHCTGLVSDHVIRAIKNLARVNSSGWIIRKFKEYSVVLLDSDDELYLNFDEPVYLIEREILENELKESAEFLGVKVFLKNHVFDVNEDGIISTREASRNYWLVVLAEGSVMRLSTRLGMCKNQEKLLGLQAVVHTDEVPESPKVLVADAIGKEFFGWAVPTGDNTALVGLATFSDPYQKLNFLMRRLEALSIIRDPRVIRFFGGLIPIGTPCQPVKGKVIGVGDTVSMIKPLTGGGLYTIVESVRALGEAFSEGIDPGRYCDKLSPIIRMLRKQHVLRKIILVLGGYPNVVKLVVELGLYGLKLRKYDLLRIDLLQSLRYLRLSR